jgi:hypothetical protein
MSAVTNADVLAGLARVYESVGFRRVGTAMIAEAP